MSQAQHKRPDGRAIELPQEKLARQKLEATLDTRTKEAQRALEKAQGGGEIDAEVAAQLQKGMGNAAIAGMVKQGSDTDTSTSGAEATLEEARTEEEDQDKDDKEAGEIEHVLPSFSTGGGGGGGGGTSPWDVGKFFGGDGAVDDDPLATVGPRWRPMPVQPDPDEEIDLLERAEDAPPVEIVEASLAAADEALGAAPWSAGVLSRGLRFPGRIVGRRAISPEGEADPIWGRARSILVFLADQSPDEDARAVATIGATLGVGDVPLVLALARELALLEAALAPLPSGWSAPCDVAGDQRARPRIEQAASALGPEGQLYAGELLAFALGDRTAPADAEPLDRAHPAALAAVTRAARPASLPIVAPWTRASLADEAPPDDLDRMIARALGEADDEDHAASLSGSMGPLYEQMNGLLAALGAVQVEIAAGALAVWPWLPDGAAEGIATEADSTLRGLARKLVELGRQIEIAAERGDAAEITSLSIRASAVASSVELVRQERMTALAGGLLDADLPARPDVGDPTAHQQGGGRTRDASYAHLGSGTLTVLASRVRTEGPSVLDAESSTRGPAGSPVSTGVLGLLVEAARESLGLWPEPGRVADDASAPFSCCYLALLSAWSAHERGDADAVRATLIAASAPLRDADEGGALNLLKAGWGEWVR